MDNKILLRVPEAAARLGVSRAWLYRELLTPGVLPVVRCGRSVRIPADALRAWASEQTEPWPGSQ